MAKNERRASSAQEQSQRLLVHFFTRASSCFALALLLFSAHADTLTGKVVKVHDGDSIHVLDAENVRTKVRLAGIDAPELGQPYGKKSREHLASLIAGKQVRVEWQKLDRYGRTVGNVYVDGADAGLELIRAGLAWHYKKYQGEQSERDRALYSEADAEAKEAGRGLFREPDYVSPWEWRAGYR